MLLAVLLEGGPQSGAIITTAVLVERILTRIGEPAQPPPIGSARRPSARD
jgi:hypothetical protein